MSSFQDAVRAWIATPMPAGSPVDALDEVHADLVLYDTWVAESVLPYLRSGAWVPAVPDVIGTLDDLRGQLEEWRSEGTDDPEAVLGYLAYVRLLRAVYVAFLREGPK